MEKITQASQVKERQLLDESDELNRQRTAEIRHLGELRQQVLGGGFVTALSGSGSSTL